MRRGCTCFDIQRLKRLRLHGGREAVILEIEEKMRVMAAILEWVNSNEVEEKVECKVIFLSERGIRKD
jgi:hypothetical protein